MSVTLIVQGTKLDINLTAVPALSPATAKVWENFKGLDVGFPLFEFGGVRTSSLKELITMQSSYGKGLWLEIFKCIVVAGFALAIISALFALSPLDILKAGSVCMVGLTICVIGIYERQRRKCLPIVEKFFNGYQEFISKEAKEDKGILLYRLQQKTTARSFSALTQNEQKQFLINAQAFVELMEHKKFFEEIATPRNMK